MAKRMEQWDKIIVGETTTNIWGGRGRGKIVESSGEGGERKKKGGKGKRVKDMKEEGERMKKRGRAVVESKWIDALMGHYGSF